MAAREQAARTRRALSMEIHRENHFFACFESVAVLVVTPKAMVKGGSGKMIKELPWRDDGVPRKDVLQLFFVRKCA